MALIAANSDESFDKVFADTAGTVLVYVGSKSCGPTMAMFETIDLFLEEMPEFEAIALSIEDCPETAKRFNIKHTPSSIVILNGVPHGTLAGTASLDQFIEFVADVVSRPPSPPKEKKPKGE